MNTFSAVSRYDRRSTAQEGTYRFLTLEECKSLSGRVLALGADGRVAQVHITSVKTWKTRPDVRIGWKFGLYEYGAELITPDAPNDFFVVEVL